MNGLRQAGPLRIKQANPPRLNPRILLSGPLLVNFFGAQKLKRMPALTLWTE
jgi:hypothetical protein